MSLQIDLQTHTNHSPSCGWMAPETVVRRAARVGLNGIAITDHNTMNAIERACQAADDVLVIPGEEIDTPDGQIIGLFLSEPIEPWQSPDAVIEKIHAQDGIAVAPHPFDAMREGLETIADYAEKLDAVETLNSRCVRSRYNERAQAFATEYALPTTGGSDAHFAREVGTAYTDVQTDIESGNKKAAFKAVKEAIRDGQVTPQGKTGSLAVHAGTKSVKIYNRIRRR